MILWPRGIAYKLAGFALWIVWVVILAIFEYQKHLGYRSPPSERLLWVACAIVAVQFFMTAVSLTAASADIRRTAITAIAVSGGICVAAAAIVGLLNAYSTGIRIPVWPVYPIFWSIFALCSLFLARSG